MKSTPLRRYTRLRPRRNRPEVRVGKVSGTVRLRGNALRELRFTCWLRDLCRRVDCGISTHWTPKFDGDPNAYDMAHIKSRGAGGSDTLENVVTKCHSCHMREHAKGIL